jgi:membrane protein required for colicin V production
MAPGSVFDVVVAAVIFVSALIAFFRGFIREVLTILGVVGGLAASVLFGPLMVPVARGWLGIKDGAEPQHLFGVVPYPVIADVIAYGGVFVAVVIVLSIVSHFLSGWARAVGLGAADRTFGVLFGIARGIVLLTLLYLPVYLLVEGKVRGDWFKGSRTIFYVDTGAEFVAGLLPKSLTADMQKKGEEKAGEAADTAREKLQELDVLKNGENKNGESKAEEGQEILPVAPVAPSDKGPATDNPPADNPAMETQPPSNQSSGYNMQERNGLDTLIQKQGGSGE